MTKKYRRNYWILLILSILLNVCPLAVYTLKAVFESQVVYQKVALTSTVFIVLIMTAVSLVNKVTLKSRLWIILIGLYICLDYIMTPLIIIAVCQVVDELIVTPLKKSSKNKLIIHKQIDARL